jgi:hypothetical protein
MIGIPSALRRLSSIVVAYYYYLRGGIDASIYRLDSDDFLTED